MESYKTEIKQAHISWGTHRKTFSRTRISGESYVHIPVEAALKFDIVRGREYIAYFSDGRRSFKIKAAGNGKLLNGTQYAKQFEGIGAGACKAFTPWYEENGAEVGDFVKVTFKSDDELLFEIIKRNEIEVF